jgi:pSer/pThr/pTyr-binding forkhead associated (FHA) protein/anti-anti-sigma regulatory factor
MLRASGAERKSWSMSMAIVYSNLAGAHEDIHQFGVSPEDSKVGERRLEDWIIGYLEIAADSSNVAAWEQLIGDLPAWRNAPGHRSRNDASLGNEGDWPRFSLSHRRGITVVRLLDQNLTTELLIHEFARDLLDLIAAGHSRLVLDFSEVERMSSWVVGAVARAYRHCCNTPGGALKLCGLKVLLAEAFAFSGVSRHLETLPDAAAAIASAWPELPKYRPLPVDLLGELRLHAVTTRGSRQSPARIDALSSELVSTPAEILETGAQQDMRKVRITVEDGQSQSKTRAFGASRLLIGRDSECDIILESPMVSKHHAIIERQSDRYIVRDLASTNGTVLNGRVLGKSISEICDGDVLELGGVSISVELGLFAPESADDLIVTWLHEDEPGPTLSDVAFISPHSESSTDEMGLLKAEVIHDVLVITPRCVELVEERLIEQLRFELPELLERPLPRRVVINLGCVGQLSGAAVGVLVAHYLRLERVGGCLRFGQVPPRLMMILHQVRLPMLVGCFASLDDAVLEDWTRRD